MNIEQKISLHLEEVRYSRVSREITKDWEEISRGYIIDSSVGAIVKIANKSVQIHHFDADGYLRKKPTKIKFKEITKVIFDDRYLDVFNKYIRTRKQ